MNFDPSSRLLNFYAAFSPHPTLKPEWYNPNVLQDLGINDVVKMRKPHPCGGYEWQVVRIGADIGLVCQTCGRRIMLDRRSLKNRIKTVVSRGEGEEPENG